MAAGVNAADWLARADAVLAAPDRPGDPREWLGALADARGLAAALDHTLLKAEATAGDIDHLCDEAKALRTATVCLNGAWVARCAARLEGSGVGLAAVIGFPLGMMRTDAKAFETRRAIDDGATELDMVVAVGRAITGEWEAVHDDVAGVVAAAGGVPVKAILETAALPPRGVVLAALAAAAAGARFVKTSTGFHTTGGASEAAVRLMRRAVGPAVGVKASGGVRTAAQTLAMLAAGANRIGTSSAPAIVAESGTAQSLIDLLAARPTVVQPSTGGYA